MVRECIENDTGFGVVRIQTGSEVYSDQDNNLPGVSDICTLASIVDHEERPDGQLGVLLEGGAKVRIHTTWEEDDHLMIGAVTFLPDEGPIPLSEKDREIFEFLRQIVDPDEVVDGGSFDFEDARDLSLFYSQYLPIPLDFKQRLLQLDDGRSRMLELYNGISIEV